MWSQPWNERKAGNSASHSAGFKVLKIAEAKGLGRFLKALQPFVMASRFSVLKYSLVRTIILMCTIALLCCP